MKHVLLLFLDGVGLGEDDPESNPFSTAALPVLTELLDGTQLFASVTRLSTARASFVPTDAQLGVPGAPQSATGQATIVVGRNVPQILGKHWGPKPNDDVRAVLTEDNIFMQLTRSGLSARLANAYPPGYIEAIESGRRMYSAIPMAVTSAGITLQTADDFLAGRAFSADFTGKGWREHLGIMDAPVNSLAEAGRQLASCTQDHALFFFEHWPTDYTGHRGTLDEAIGLLERLDGLLGGLLESWDDENGLLIITSDHGNMEDMSTRKHTKNLVPTLLVGPDHAARADKIHTLADITPAILEFLDISPAS